MEILSIKSLLLCISIYIRHMCSSVSCLSFLSVVYYYYDVFPIFSFLRMYSNLCSCKYLFVLDPKGRVGGGGELSFGELFYWAGYGTSSEFAVFPQMCLYTTNFLLLRVY
jgi:hypothetical protein